MKTKVELVEALYAEYNAGRMPVALRMAYATYCDLCTDAAFFDEMDYDKDPRQFQGLPVIFDSWYRKVKIETKPIEG